MRIAVLSETDPVETRVAATPDMVKKMARDPLIVVGGFAFAVSLATVEEFLARREGLQDIHFVDSGHGCTEYPGYKQFHVEVHGEYDVDKSVAWMDRIQAAMADHFPFHRCWG